MMDSFKLTLSGEHFICPSILNDNFAGQSNLGCGPLLFITLNTSCQSLLACNVTFEKSADSLMGTPLFFSLAAFKVFSISLTFGILIIMCLGVVLFGSNLFGTLWASWISMPISFTRLGKFYFIIFSNKFLISCSSSSAGTPVIQMLVHWEMSQRPLILSLFFLILFFFLPFWLNAYFFLMFQIVDLNPGFMPSTVASL